MKRKRRKKKKGIATKIKRIPASLLFLGIISGSIGCLLLVSCILGVTSANGHQYLYSSMFFAILGMGIILMGISYILLSGKYKLSSKELDERAKRRPDLTCKNCGQRPTLYIDYEGGSKTLYGNKCPYCGHRLY